MVEQVKEFVVTVTSTVRYSICTPIGIRTDPYGLPSCEYMGGLSKDEAMDIIARWRSPEVWDGDRLRSAVWM